VIFISDGGCVKLLLGLCIAFLYYVAVLEAFLYTLSAFALVSNVEDM
jgi:hypothetical protein